MEYDAGWHSGVVQSVHTNPNDPNSPMKDTAVKNKVALFAMPGISASQPFKSFLGGSVLGVTKDSKDQALAAEFIKFYTDTKSETAFIGLGNLPNTTVAAERGQRQPGRRPAGRGRRSGVLVHPGLAELGERREPAGPAGHVPGDRHRHRSEDGGSRCRREDQHHSQRVLTLR